jgi:hypothetical protein
MDYFPSNLEIQQPQHKSKTSPVPAALANSKAQIKAG